jgi:DNA-directed RNA polymerase subunit RPC12/RpoP
MMVAVINSFAVKLGLLIILAFKEPVQLQCIQCDGKIFMKVVVSVFDVKGDATYSVGRLRTRFEPDLSKARA